MNQSWPEYLWIVRHGQSAGNVARDAAHEAGQSVIDIADRDMDVPLSELGREQSLALANWFAEMPVELRPTALMVSPYLRAIQTADAVCLAGGLHPAAADRVIDERLREKEFGVLDRLTRTGIAERFPDQAEARLRTGKFYHRPPGGESWCDVILRLRSVLDTISLHFSHPGSRVLIVAHQVIVLCFRYLIEQMTEAQILVIDAKADVANCGVTEYALVTRPGLPAQNAGLRLVRYNFSAPVRAATAVTSSPDAPVAPR